MFEHDQQQAIEALRRLLDSASKPDWSGDPENQSGFAMSIDSALEASPAFQSYRIVKQDGG